MVLLQIYKKSVHKQALYPPLRIIPAPKNHIPLITCAAIREVELGSTAAERYVNSIAPPITKEFVLMPAGLPLDSLSAPITNPAARAMIMSIRSKL